jgi:hypothetical protein
VLKVDLKKIKGIYHHYIHGETKERSLKKELITDNNIENEKRQTVEFQNTYELLI